MRPSHITSNYQVKVGVLIAFHTDIQSSMCSIGYDYGIAQISVCASIGRLKYLFICCCIPPRSSPEVYQSHVDSIVSTIDKFTDDVIWCVCGDFNLPSLRYWIRDDDSGNVISPLHVTNECETILIDNLLSNDLVQINCIPNDNKVSRSCFL